MKSIILTLLAVFLTLSVSAQTTIGLATYEELEAAGLSRDKVDVPGGTVILDNDAGTFSLAYDDQWGIGYVYYNYKYVQVGDSEVIELGNGAVGSANPTFVSYEEGVMSAGAVFRIEAKKNGWMTLFVRMNPNKQYIVFEGNSGAVPYTLGTAGADYKINYSLPFLTAGDGERYIDFNAAGASKYFTTATRQLKNEDGELLWYDEDGNVVAGEKPVWIDDYGIENTGTPVTEEIPGQIKPQFPWLVAGLENDPDAISTGFLTFKVRAGKTYYFSALGSKAVCGGFVFTEGETEPAVTFYATGEFPEVIFNTHDDFQCDGIWYTVIDPDAKTCKTKEGTSIDGQIRAGNSFEGNLVIPPTVSDGTNEYSVVTIGFHSFDSNTGLVSVSLPMGLTSIEDGAFLDCNNLESVSLPSSLSKIGLSAFRYCWGLTDVALPDNLTEISEGLFYDCYNLANVKMPSSLTQIGFEAFTYSRALQFIELPETLVSIANGAFSGGGLTALTLPASVESLGEISFSGCPIVSLTLPSSLKTIGFSAFSDCYDIKNITYFSDTPITADESVFNGNAYENATLDVPNATLASVQATVPWNQFGRIVAKDGSVGIGLSAGDDFEYDGIWYTVIDPDAKTCKTKDGASGYAGNTATGDLVIPEKVSDGVNEYAVVEIGSDGFYYSQELTSVVIPNSVTKISLGAFQGCMNLASIILPERLTAIESAAFFNCYGLTSVTLPESLTFIGESAFQACTALSSVSFSEGLTSIGVHVFESCSGLTSISLPNSIATIGDYAFHDCSGLTSLSLPDNLTSIGDFAFQGCTSLTSVAFPENLTSIGSLAFNGCHKLVSVKYDAVTPISIDEIIFDDNVYSAATLNTPNATLASVQATEPWNKFGRIIAKDGSVGIGLSAGDDFEYDGMWYTVIDPDAKTCMTKAGNYISNGDGTGSYVAGNVCSGTVTIPTHLSYNDESYTVTQIGEIGFYGCTELLSMSIPESVTSIGMAAFDDCYNLSSVNIPEGVTSIEAITFQACSSLSSLIIPDGVTKIDVYAFSGCSSLTSLVLPDSLSYIGESAFNGCTGLTSVDIPSGLTSLGNSAFAYCFRLKSIRYAAAIPISSNENVFDSDAYSNAILNTPNATLASVQATIPWNKFQRIEASDGSFGVSLSAGEDFQYNGILYTVIDPDAKTCRTKAGDYDFDNDRHIPGNAYSGNLVIPAKVSFNSVDYFVIEIGYAGFAESDIASIVLPEGLTNISSSAFINSKAIVSAVLPETLTTIGSTAFFGCAALKEVNLPNSLVELGYSAFECCGSLESIDVPDSITILNDYVFRECESLTSVRLPQNLTSIGVNAFFCCYGLTSIDLPESLITIKDAAFYCCKNLKQVNMPESLESLGVAAFKECYAMTSVTLPASLKELGEIAFEFCNLTEVNYNAASLISASDNVFSQSVYNGAILNTPNATLASVQATVPWNKFGHIVAEDGSVGIGLSAGDDFEYDGIWYTVIDSEAMTCKTKDASVDFAGNVVAGNLVIPESVTYNGDRYTVTGIGVRSFNSCSGLYSVTLPVTIENFGSDAFADCRSLAAVEWKGSTVLPESFISQIGNPNLLIYVDHAGSVPGSVDRNVVEPDGSCSSLVLTPGYPFNPIRAFTALHGSMTKEFTQPTEIGICRGWETLTLPFEPQRIMHESGKEIVPFESWTKLNADTRPFWLYGASADGWQAAPTIKRGVPYIISMPNNPEYVADYNLAGNVTFTAENVTLGTEESLPQTSEWIEGMRFRGTFMPVEEEGVLSLNTAGEGGMLPGSVFTSAAATLPFGAYVTGAGTRRSVPVFGDFTGVELPKVSEHGITVDVSVPGAIRIASLNTRRVAVNTVTGAVVAEAEIPAGDSIVVDGLPAGIYIVAGMKVMVK